jgi:YbbR domain-containing protein
MKTVKKVFVFIFALAILVSGKTFAFNGNPEEEKFEVTASEKFAYSIYAIQSSLKFRLNFDNEDGSNVTVKVLDPQGKVVFSETIKKQVEARRNYDLSAVGKGVYTVEIIDGDFKASHKVGIGGASIEKKEFSAYVSKIQDGSVKVAYENGGEDGVNIVLKDEKGNIVYDEISQDAQYARKFNLSKLRKGTYTMSVTSGRKTVEQVCNIQ